MSQFQNHIARLLKTLTDNGITSNAKQQLNSILCILSKIISNKAIELVIYSSKKTLSEKEIIGATLLCINPPLSSSLIDKAKEASEHFEKVEELYISRQKKAGIILPPCITEKFIRYMGISNLLVTKLAPVYLASILESILIIIFNDAILISSTNRHSRITIRDLELSIRQNKDINKLFTRFNINLLGGGVVPFIHPSIKTNKNKIAIRDIKKLQKTNNCLFFSKLPFSRIVRNIMNSHKKVKVSKNFFISLQYYIEQYITDFLKDVNTISLHCKRIKVTKEDVLTICKLRKLDIEDETEDKEIETQIADIVDVVETDTLKFI